MGNRLQKGQNSVRFCLTVWDMACMLIYYRLWTQCAVKTAKNFTHTVLTYDAKTEMPYWQCNMFFKEKEDLFLAQKKNNTHTHTQIRNLSWIMYLLALILTQDDPLAVYPWVQWQLSGLAVESRTGFLCQTSCHHFLSLYKWEKQYQANFIGTGIYIIDKRLQRN